MGRLRGARRALEWVCASALAFVLAACGGKSKEDDGKSKEDAPSASDDTSSLFGSGTRLKAHYYDGGGGARYLLDFYDSKLGLTCDFRESAHGEYHCLPLPVANASFTADAYFDADCTEPAYQVTRTSFQSTGDWVTVPSFDCGALATPATLLEQKPLDEVYGHVEGECVGFNTASISAWTLQPAPVDEFVRGSVKLIGQTGDVQVSRIIGEDGSYRNLTPVSPDGSCGAVRIDGEQRCVPEPISQPDPTVFGDASCTNLLGVWLPSPAQLCAKSSPSIGVSGSLEDCTDPSSPHELVGPVAIQYLNSTGGCVEESLMHVSGASFYAFGDERAASDFPLLGIGLLGTDQLKLAVITNSAGLPLVPAPGGLGPSWQLPDGTACALTSWDSGPWRCTPQSFQNAECTAPALPNNDQTDFDLDQFPIVTETTDP